MLDHRGILFGVVEREDCVFVFGGWVKTIFRCQYSSEYVPARARPSTGLPSVTSCCLTVKLGSAEVNKVITTWLAEEAPELAVEAANAPASSCAQIPSAPADPFGRYIN
jgi:hypothetical protein